MSAVAISDALMLIVVNDIYTKQIANRKVKLDCPVHLLRKIQVHAYSKVECNSLGNMYSSIIFKLCNFFNLHLFFS